MMSANDEPVALSDLVATYAATRRADDLARLREAVRTSPGFDPGLDVVGTVAPLLAKGANDEVLARVRDLMPGAFFGPSTHAALGAAHHALGDADSARRERRFQALALDSILSAGDGTRERPWSVLRISDEYDVLRSQRRASSTQTLVVDGGRSLDRHLCGDGTEAWFDVTGLVSTARPA
jgi:hypothetical protein